MNIAKLYQFKIHLLKIIEINLNEKMIYFLGSGFSMNFSISNWESFVVELIENLIDYYQKTGKNSLDIKNLESLKKESKFGNLNFVLQKIYNISQMNDYSHKTSEYYEINKIIKKTYSKKFYLKKFNKINNDNLLFFKNNLKKIITTNYDNLFFLYYSLKEIFSAEFQEKIWTLKNPRDLIKEKHFYVPIHGTIMNDTFDENKNDEIWDSKEKGDLVNFGIIDSFERYEKAYSYSIKPNENIFNIKKYFDNFLSVSYDAGFSLLFFGYSFNDLSIADSLIKFLSKSEVREDDFRDYNFIYIMNYDLENYIINEIFEDKEIEQATNIIENDKVVSLNLSSFFELWISDKRYANFKREFEGKMILLRKKVKELKEVLSSNQFEYLGDLENSISIIKQIPEFFDVKKFLDQKLIESVRDIFEIFSKTYQKIKEKLKGIDAKSPIFTPYKFVIKNLELLKEGIYGTASIYPFLSEPNFKKLLLLYEIIFNKKYNDEYIKDSDWMVNDNNRFIYAYSLIDQFNLNDYLSSSDIEEEVKRVIFEIYNLFFDSFKPDSLRYYDEENDEWKVEKLPNFFRRVIFDGRFKNEVNNIKKLFIENYSFEEWKEWSDF